jgi:hypothetical protein
MLAMRKDIRGAKAREEMHAKGFLQVRELAEKLTAETGKRVTAKALRCARERGRIKGFLHKGSNIWFFPADTKYYPGKLPENLVRRATKGYLGPDEPLELGPWAVWPAPDVTGGGWSPGWFGISEIS